MSVVTLLVFSILFPNQYTFSMGSTSKCGFKKIHIGSQMMSYRNDLDYSWHKTDTSIALLKGPGVVIWQLNHTNPNNKPYFCPLTTTKGHNLVWSRPADHPWHYGLWFSWKFINNVNYWEEDRTSRLPEGKAVTENVSIDLSEDFSAIIKFQITYLDEDESRILFENRELEISPPDRNGNYYIDWSFTFKSQSDSVILDRTPPKIEGGPYYGGYAGLSYRASQSMTEHIFLDSENWVNKDELVGHGKKAQWMDLTGTVDSTGTRSGVAMFNHPRNDGGEVPWYVYKKGDFAFYNAGLLFDKSKVIVSEDVLILKYRVLIHNDEMSGSEIYNYYFEYIKGNNN